MGNCTAYTRVPSCASQNRSKQRFSPEIFEKFSRKTWRGRKRTPISTCLQTSYDRTILSIPHGFKLYLTVT